MPDHHITRFNIVTAKTNNRGSSDFAFADTEIPDDACFLNLPIVIVMYMRDRKRFHNNFINLSPLTPP